MAAQEDPSNTSDNAARGRRIALVIGVNGAPEYRNPPIAQGKPPECWLRQAGQVGAEDQSLLRIFAGHTNWVSSVAFAPDGQRVLTGSGDRTARLWDAASGQALARFEGHTSGVSSVAFAPDGRLMVTCDDYGWVFFWRANGTEMGYK